MSGKAAFKYIFFVLFAWAGLFKCYSALAQQPINATSIDAKVTGIEELVGTGNFRTAKKKIEEILAQPNYKASERLAYLNAYCALKLNDGDAIKLYEKYVSEYPLYARMQLVYADLGLYYFAGKNYEKAASYLGKIKTGKLSSEQEIECRFKLGYAKIIKKDFTGADSAFALILDKDHPYTAAANYYAGYIAVKKSKFDNALKYLTKAESDPEYKKMVGQLKTIVYYRRGNFKSAIEVGLEAMADKESKGKDETALLVAESFYQTEAWARADSVFSVWQKLNRGPVSLPIQYRIAFTKLKQNEIAKAIEYFKPILKVDSAAKKDSLGQLAAYYTGVCHLQMKNKAFALSSFDAARRNPNNKTIQSLSWFNYGKLLYDLARYDDAIDALKLYTLKFPTTNNLTEANELISDAFLQTNSWDEALEHIGGLEYKSAKVKAAFQRVCILKGELYYNNAEYKQAIAMFDSSNLYPADEALTVTATYWSAEGYYQIKEYEKAFLRYKQVFNSVRRESEWYVKSLYALAYCKYNLKDYPEALEHFRKYVANIELKSERPYYGDALIRLAECYYVQKLYPTAISNLKKAIDENVAEIDYAYYRLGRVQQMNNQSDEALQSFNSLIKGYSTSAWYDDALYHYGEILLDKNRYDEAVSSLTKAIENSKDEVMLPYAHLKRGVAFTNVKQDDKASKDYKLIIDSYASHPSAEGAINGLQELVASTGNVEEMNDYIEKFKKANPDNTSIESIQFETAKGLYFNQSYVKAEQAFVAYLNSYPNNALTADALYYLAESRYRLNKKDLALENYLQVLRSKQGNNKSISRVAEIYLAQNNNEEALKYYTLLRNMAANKKETNSALFGMLEANFRLNALDTAAAMAEKLLELPGIQPEMQTKATLISGKIAYQRGDFEKAIDEFLAISNSSTDQTGAEALYLVGEIQNRQAKYKESITTLFELNKNYAGYKNWYDKSFLLIAENYVSLNELFQARYVLERVAEKSPIKESRDAAAARLTQLNKETTPTQP